MKQVLVVGGGGGLGGAIVKQLLDEGYKVVVAGRTKAADERIGKYYSIDAANTDWQGLYAQIEQETAAPVDGLVFVAGSAVFGQTTMIPLERARQIFELNFWACASAATRAAQYWDGRKRSGKFVAILSIVARRAVPFEAYYSASKAATARFLECLQLEYAHKRIEFLCAFPGMLNTAFRRQAEWYGFAPAYTDGGADVQVTAQAVINLLEGRRSCKVIGWRERSIDLADRFFPGLYDRAVLRNRVQRLLNNL